MNGIGLTENTFLKTRPNRLGCCFLIRTDIMKKYDVNIRTNALMVYWGISLKTNSHILNCLHLFVIDHQKTHHGTEMPSHFSAITFTN